MASSNRHFQAGDRGTKLQRAPTRPVLDTLPKPEASQAKISVLTLASASSWEKRSDSFQIKNVEHVTSFNWMNARDPTILVPGEPPKWLPPSHTRTLREDSGSYYRDPNSAHFSSYPTEPALRAIRETFPDFNLSEIDIFACGNTIGNLILFARDEERTFRMGVERIGSSLFLVRKTNKPGELIEDVRGFGHTFPEAYTCWNKSVRGSHSHQRIIKYDFAGLKCFIRSESDGYLPGLVSQSSHPVDNTIVKEDPALDVNHFMGLAVDLHVSSGSNKLNLKHAGNTIPHRAIFDLKTRSLHSKRNDLTVDAFLPRLWVNQTPSMILAYHSSGRFEPYDIHIIDVRSKLVTWESVNETVLSILGDLLHKLIAIAQNDGRHTYEIRRTGKGPLEVWSEVPQWSALSHGLKRELGVTVAPEEKPRKTDKQTNANGSEDADENKDYLKF